MLGNVISVKDLHRIFTSLEEFLILFLALGHLLNGGLDIIGPFPKAFAIKLKTII